jgi:hypothetical protein
VVGSRQYQHVDLAVRRRRERSQGEADVRTQGGAVPEPPLGKLETPVVAAEDVQVAVRAEDALGAPTVLVVAEVDAL